MSEILWGEMHCSEGSFTIQELTPEGEIFSTLYTCNGIPDYAKLPKDLGGETVKILADTLKKCPNNLCQHNTVVHFLLKATQTETETKILCVARCPDHGWQFYERVHLEE
jgi:hypothetical protein